jgi:hypothetical protein
VIGDGAPGTGCLAPLRITDSPGGAAKGCGVRFDIVVQPGAGIVLVARGRVRSSKFVVASPLVTAPAAVTAAGGWR